MLECGSSICLVWMYCTVPYGIAKTAVLAGVFGLAQESTGVVVYYPTPTLFITVFGQFV